LDAAQAGELLRISGPLYGMVLNLEEDNVGVASLVRIATSAKETSSSVPARSRPCPSAPPFWAA